MSHLMPVFVLKAVIQCPLTKCIACEMALPAACPGGFAWPFQNCQVHLVVIAAHFHIVTLFAY